MNPFYHLGWKIFTKAEEYNIQGTIIPDLPFEMAQNYDELFKNIINQIFHLLHQQTVKKESKDCK